MMLAAALLVPATAAADDIKYFLNNTGLDADAMGKARYREKNGEERFEVQVSSMTPGSYEVTVGDLSVGTFAVGEEGDGKLRLRAADLGFDPRGQSVEVQAEGDSGSVYFASTLPASQADADRKVKLRVKFTNETDDPSVKGDAKYKSANGKAMLDVKAQKLPVGTYGLYVGGSHVGDITVVTDEDGDTVGQVKYDSRFGREGKQVLSFDPYCQSLAVSETVDLVTTELLTIAVFGTECP
jgi:hypothetical protein